MAPQFTIEQGIEGCKILIWLAIAIVGGSWTYVEYTRDVRDREQETLSILGAAIGGMEATCKEDMGPIIDLWAASQLSRKGRCYGYFIEVRSISLVAQITVRRPFRMREEIWKKQWFQLDQTTSSSAAEKFDSGRIRQAWNVILKSKGI